jgi:hypothetical protein
MKKLLLSAGIILVSCGPPTVVDPCKGRAAGDLVVTEMMLDPEGTDTGSEWVEIFNTLGTPLEIKGMTIYTRDTDGSGLKSHVIKAGTIPARGYFVLGDIRSGPNPAWINYTYNDTLGSFGNARGVIGMKCGTTVFDEITYTKVAKANRSRMLDGSRDPSATDNDIETNLCDAPAGTVYSGTSAGTPGTANPVCQPEAMTGTCLENGAARPIVKPAAGDLVVTEIMADPDAVSDTTGEWIEVLARRTVDLNDVTVTAGTSSDQLASMQCLKVTTGQYAVIARNADSFLNGNLPTPVATYGVSLANSATRLSLSIGDAGIDEASVLAPSAGRSWQLNPTGTDPVSNDSPSNFCVAPNRWSIDGGGDFGSPGNANPSCSGSNTDAGVCTGRTAGDLVITEVMIDPDGTDTGNEWIELFNPTAGPIDLTNMVLYLKDVNGANIKPVTLTSGIIAPLSRFVLGDVRALPLPAWINGSYDNGLGAIANASGMVGIQCGTTVIDEMKYTIVAKSARSRQMNGLITPTAMNNDVEANWCDVPTGNIYFGINNGTPGSQNPECVPEALMGTCIDPVTSVIRPVNVPVRGDLIINEIMANPGVASSTATGAWFELLATKNVDLNDVSLASATSSARISSMSCLPVLSGEFVILARSADAFVNGDLPPPRATYSLSLSTMNERLSLFRGDSGIDEAAIFASSKGTSWQLDPQRMDNVSNDDPNNFCKSPNKAKPDGGGDFGSPAVANPMCMGMASVNDCIDPVSMMPRPVVRPTVGDVVITEWMADPNGTDTGKEWFEILAKTNFDLNGLRLGNEGAAVANIQGQGCIGVTAGQHVVFASSSNPTVNGGLPSVAATFGFTLANSGARRITVSLPDAGELDRIDYSNATSGASTALRPDGGIPSPSDNDVVGNLCPTPVGVTYGTDIPANRGTPAGANAACP